MRTPTFVPIAPCQVEAVVATEISSIILKISRTKARYTFYTGMKAMCKNHNYACTYHVRMYLRHGGVKACQQSLRKQIPLARLCYTYAHHFML